MADFFIERRIYYHNTDAGGVVYYGNYLRFLEEGIVELLRYNGIETGSMHHDKTLFATAHIDLEYKSPARYGDMIAIAPSIERIGNSSIRFRAKISKGQALLVQATVVWVCIGEDFETRPLSETIRGRLKMK